MATRAALATAAFAALLGCDSSAPPDDAIPIGLLLSFSGDSAANSTNSERALQLAIETANAGGGVRGRPLKVLARNTRSDPTQVAGPALELLNAGATLFIGPDTPELAVPLVTPLGKQVLLLPSFATAHSAFRRPNGWFVMGTGTARVACELYSQVRAHGRKNPVVLLDRDGYNALVAWELTRTYGLPQLVLPSDRSSSRTSLQPILAAGADSYVLVALPGTASSLVFAMAAVGALGDPTSWYLSPTLHNPAFLNSIPAGALTGARGVAPGTWAGAADFRVRFTERWQDAPLDDAYPFYDAGAVAALALHRAVLREGAIPAGEGLTKHIVAVTRPGGMPIRWNELATGLRLLEAGQEIEYIGLTGLIQFDLSGQTPTSNTKWWTIDSGGFTDIERQSDCTAQ
jgi:neutral amino acid transport system substrate-binding protein